MTRRPGSAEARGVAEVPSAIPPLVLGLGNLLLGDDAVGLRLLEELRDGAMPGVADPVDFVDGGTQGLALLGLLSGRPSVLLLDAVCRGAPPGTVHVLDLDEALDLAATHGGTAHEGGCGGLLAIARLTGDLPLRAKVVGVEPRRVETGIGLSEDVARAVPTAVERAREVLAEMLREAGPSSPAPAAR